MEDPAKTNPHNLNNKITLQSVGLIVLVAIVIWKLLHPGSKLPPGPKPWPVIGNIPALVKEKKKNRHVHEVLAQWAQRYGSVMSVRLFPGKAAAVVLSDIHAVKEALLKQAEIFSWRTVSAIKDKPFGGVHGSYLWDSGDNSKSLRHFALAGFRTMGVGKRSLENKINEELQYLVECFDSKKGQPFDSGSFVRNAASNIICSICFGSRFEYDDERFQKMVAILKYLAGISSVGSIWNLVPFLVNTPLFSKGQRCIDSLKEFLSEIVQEHRASYDSNDLRDIIDMYIAETRRQDQEGGTGSTQQAKKTPFSEERIWRGVYDLFGAGTDTTANTVLWLITFVLAHPEIQEKMQKEISDVIADNRQPACEDRVKMPYTNAVIMEIQRWRPTVTIAVPYKTSQETRLQGHTILKGTTVLVNLWAVMHDPNIWERPDEFDPSRFLTEDGQKIVTPEAFIPFSIGRRNCLGESLAKMELFLFVTNLFQRFTFKLASGAPLPKLIGISGLTFVPEDFQVCAVKR